MTEDILFDNIYVGHSIEDANAFKAETFDIKKPLEVAAKNKKTEVDDDEELTFGEDPIGFIRYKVLDFIDLARLDPVLAFKTSPETGAALGLAALTFFGMIAALFGLVGAQQKPVVTKVRVRDAVLNLKLTLPPVLKEDRRSFTRRQGQEGDCPGRPCRREEGREVGCQEACWQVKTFWVHSTIEGCTVSPCFAIGRPSAYCLYLCRAAWARRVSKGAGFALTWAYLSTVVALGIWDQHLVAYISY